MVSKKSLIVASLIELQATYEDKRRELAKEVYWLKNRLKELTVQIDGFMEDESVRNGVEEINRIKEEWK